MGLDCYPLEVGFVLPVEGGDKIAVGRSGP